MVVVPEWTAYSATPEADTAGVPSLPGRRQIRRRRCHAVAEPGQASDVGSAVAALSTGAMPYSTGDVIHVDGGMHLPRL